jgi:hypothetical protein
MIKVVVIDLVTEYSRQDAMAKNIDDFHDKIIHMQSEYYCSAARV